MVDLENVMVMTQPWHIFGCVFEGYIQQYRGWGAILLDIARKHTVFPIYIYIYIYPILPPKWNNLKHQGKWLHKFNRKTDFYSYLKLETFVKGSRVGYPQLAEHFAFGPRGFNPAEGNFYFSWNGTISLRKSSIWRLQLRVIPIVRAKTPISRVGTILLVIVPNSGHISEIYVENAPVSGHIICEIYMKMPRVRGKVKYISFMV